MTQPNQTTPTMQANLDGTSTTVNLRDWLNTRLSPFLKKAIIESLDSQAQYPLQWLGEQLIQQSIQFEGNPDSTNIRERFLYNHDMTSSAAQDPGSVQPQGAVDSQPPGSGEQPQAAAVVNVQPENHMPIQPTIPEEGSVPTDTVSESGAAQTHQVPSMTSVNGTAGTGEEEQRQDTDMSNAS